MVPNIYFLLLLYNNKSNIIKFTSKNYVPSVKPNTSFKFDKKKKNACGSTLKI